MDSPFKQILPHHIDSSIQRNATPSPASKNGSVLRKMLGNWHIARPHAELLDRFHREVLADYPNYHRPCLFPHVETDAKGKRSKTSRQADIRPPYEALKALPEAESYLRLGVTFAELDREAYAKTDLEAARDLQQAREALYAELLAAAREPSRFEFLWEGWGTRANRAPGRHLRLDTRS